MRGVTPARNGGVRVRLSPRERDLLRSLPGQLRPLLSGDEPAPTLTQRLFPPGYDDAKLQREYSELVGSDIVDQRVAAMDAFTETLAGGTVSRGRWTLDLDADEAAAWLSAVNDSRLILGGLLGIEEEAQWEDGPSDDNPTSVVLYYLGWLEEELVAALMGALPEAAT